MSLHEKKRLLKYNMRQRLKTQRRKVKITLFPLIEI